ncbi:MAG: NADP-dependent malic enzyme [Actinomycetota bacterium]|nr:NADP-dependent malic enzyme [Actinomycetota bacterium]
MTALPPDDPRIFALHEGGKLEVRSSVAIRGAEDLSMVYTPGVAQVCRAIVADPSLAARYTWAGRLIAVVTDGTAVLGLGDIGPRASLPVMEGKACLFREFAGLDAIPIALDTTDVDDLVETIVRLAPSFGGINLEDISAPRCFEVEQRVKDRVSIPVMHDDQHGTAIVVLAALQNAATVTGRSISDLRVVVSGAGAAGVACTKMLLAAGVGDIAVADSRGIIHGGRADLTPIKAELAAISNRSGYTGSLGTAMADADVLLGVSRGSIPESDVASMASEAIIFALANPDPEVHPEVAHRYARVVGTGRSDYPNQINNVLAFPGVFRGAIDAGATAVTEAMKQAAAGALADLVAADLREDYVIPGPFDPRVAEVVAAAVSSVANRQASLERIPR